MLIDGVEIYLVKYVIRFGMFILNGIRKLFYFWKKWKIIIIKKVNILCWVRYRILEVESFIDNKYRIIRELEEDWYFRSRSG